MTTKGLFSAHYRAITTIYTTMYAFYFCHIYLLVRYEATLHVNKKLASFLLEKFLNSISTKTRVFLKCLIRKRQVQGGR